MTHTELRELMAEAVRNGYPCVRLVLPNPWPGKAKGFPRREFLCVNADGESVYQVDVIKLLQWERKRCAAAASNTSATV